MERVAADLWRVIAAVAVVAIHAAGGFESRWAGGDGSPDTWLAVGVSQWARFSVPLFLVFSGYGLAHSDIKRGDGPFDARAFWRRRGSRIIAPYLAFTLAGLWWAGRLSPEHLGIGLMRGNGDYHLYFLAFLLQGYVLWPALRRPSWALVAGLFALQFVFSSPTHVLWPGRPHVPAWLIIHWAGYIALGARLARSPSAWCHGMAYALMAWLASMALVWLEYGWWAQRLPDPGHFNHFCRWTVIVYALCTVWLWRASAACIARRLDGHASTIGWLGGLTFTVYLIHPWMLRALYRLPVDWAFGTIVVAATIAALAGAAGLDRALPRTRGARWLRRGTGLG